MRLVTLGGLVLTSAAGEDAAGLTQRRKLALLAVLAIARRPIPRDTLVDMFWGEEDEKRARHSLSNALTTLRRVLGPAAIATRRLDIALSDEARLAVDAVEFAAACEVRDFARALALYGGPFLNGVYVECSNEFDTWVSRERARLERAFVQACEAHFPILARAGKWSDGTAVAARWAEAAPGSTAPLVALLNAGLSAAEPKHAATALADYRRLVAAYVAEHGAQLDSRVAVIADRLAERVAADEERALAQAPGPELHVVPAPASAALASAAPAGSAPDRAIAATTPPPTPVVAGASLSWGRRLAAGSGPVIAAVIVAVLAAQAAPSARTPYEPALPAVVSNRPVIAVTGIQSARGDTATAWLQAGMQQMISADLARNASVDVVDPSRVREVLARAQYNAIHPLTSADARDIAHRLGATWLVTGGVTRGNEGTIVLDVSLRSVASGELLALFTVTGTNSMAVADQAAVRVLSRSDADALGPHLAEIETANLTAHEHYVRAVQALGGGRNADTDDDLDAAIAADSGFGSALVLRLGSARADGNAQLVARLTQAFQRASPRATRWDEMSEAAYAAFHNGETARAELLAR